MPSCHVRGVISGSLKDEMCCGPLLDKILILWDSNGSKIKVTVEGKAVTYDD